MFDLEQASKYNPTKMWDMLSKLSNPPSSKVVLEIIREDETISTDIEEILQRWHKDISNLFSGLRENTDLAFDENFYQEIKNKKEEFDKICHTNVSLSGYNSSELNYDILFDEVSKCIDSSKMRKAYLDIPNEALKNQNAKVLLHKFYNLCFQCGLNPTDWDNNDIKPIQKKG